MADDNLSAEQTDKLIHFQEITHIDSIDQCKQILEAFDWNIELAVQNTFNDQPNANQNETSQLNNPQNLLEPIDNENYENDDASMASTSSSSPTGASSHHHPILNPNIQRTLNNSSSNHNQQNNSINNTSLNSSFSSSNQLPNVNIFTQRTLSYRSPREQAIVPQGFFQWSMFIVAFPLKFLFSTFMDIISFFWSFFESSSIPIDYDPLVNIAEYAIYYNQKYGNNHPNFYQGSYSQAINEAKRDLKFLLVYIHQNDHKDCNTFSTETLTNQDLIDYINNAFLFWSCSKNLPEGRKVFNALKAKRAPFLGVIVLRNSRMTLISKIEGPITAAELLMNLANLTAEYEQDLTSARMDREQRSQNQLLRQQQDQAYLESLKQDQEKARRKQEQEEAQRRALELERQKVEEERERENAILNRKSQLRKQLAETPQPDASNPLAIKLIIKLPTGNRFERVFLKTDPLSQLYEFVFSNEECPLNFEIVTNFPRKHIECNEDTKLSIQEFGINQSMLLFVNDLDA